MAETLAAAAEPPAMSWSTIRVLPVAAEPLVSASRQCVAREPAPFGITIGDAAGCAFRESQFKL